MTDKYENMSLDELKKLKEEREKKALIANLAEQDKLEQEKLENEQREKLRDEIREELLKEHPELAPQSKIELNPEKEKAETKSENSVELYCNAYYDRHKTFETKSGYVNSIDVSKNTRFQVYRNQRWEEAGLDLLFENTNSDSGCDDVVDAWSPADNYSKIVWNTFVCKADLFKICVKGISINPGDGLGVQIRAYGAFGNPSELGACECASCASISFTTYSLTLKQYNLEGIICDKDIFDVGSILMDSYIDAMSDSWARWFDAQIYSELETATPGTSETLGAGLSCTPAIVGSCCSDASLVNLYNAVHNVVANMREGNGLAGPYEPDYLLISPSVAAIFKRMQQPTPMPWMGDISFDSDGRLTKISGLKVIEYCGANSCTDASGEEVAIIIDSRRAVGAVFGQKPKTYKFFQTNCNSYRIDQWAYFAVGELDTDAIGHIVNP